MIEIIKAIIFGIVEGITEWLPVSSTGHLILLEEFLPLSTGSNIHPAFAEEFGEMFNVVIQLGAILAVLVTYWRRLIPTKKEQLPATFRLWLKIVIASLPAAFAGLVLLLVFRRRIAFNKRQDQLRPRQYGAMFLQPGGIVMLVVLCGLTLLSLLIS